MKINDLLKFNHEIVRFIVRHKEQIIEQAQTERRYPAYVAFEQYSKDVNLSQEMKDQFMFVADCMFERQMQYN